MENIMAMALCSVCNFQPQVLGDFHNQVLSAARACEHKILVVVHSKLTSYHLTSTKFPITT